jgi:hypothetical protein
MSEPRSGETNRPATSFDRALATGDSADSAFALSLPSSDHWPRVMRWYANRPMTSRNDVTPIATAAAVTTLAVIADGAPEKDPPPGIR